MRPRMTVGFRHVGRLLCASLALASGCAGSAGDVDPVGEQQSSLAPITLTYKANTEFFGERPDCDTSKNILVKEPAGAGRYPVLIFLTGTWGVYNGNYPNGILTEAANEGFVAASVDYNVNSLKKMCEENGWYKDRCMFSTSFNSQSAIAAICARPKADCSQGVVVVGHSQGGALAAMARNFDTRIRGAWTMGFVSRHWDGTPQPCMDEGPAALGTATKRILKNDRLRVFRGGNEGVDIAFSNQTTGLSCPAGTTSCLVGAHASGWYYPPNAEVSFTLNPNKHCFMESNPLSGGNKVDCADPHTIDPKFAAVPPATTYPSGMYANLQWLKNTILPLGDQP